MMLSRSLVGVLGLAVILTPTLLRAEASESDQESDPSCVSVEVNVAPTWQKYDECASVAVAVTLSASSDPCASNLRFYAELEGSPRDVKTFGTLDSSAVVSGDGVEWTAPLLTDASKLGLEFVMDLCGYCEKYGDSAFNPIDSIDYGDDEGNEPNELWRGYTLKIPCEGYPGDPVGSIFVTPAPTTAPAQAPTTAPRVTESPLTTQAPYSAVTLNPFTPSPTKPAKTLAPSPVGETPPPTAAETTPAPSVKRVTVAPDAPAPVESFTLAPTRPPAETDDDEMGYGEGSGELEAGGPTPGPTPGGGERDGEFGTGVPTNSPDISIFYTEAPTSSPTSTPTSSPTSSLTSAPTGGISTPAGLTLKIQSIFEARRRRLVTEEEKRRPDYDGRQRRLKDVYEEDAAAYDVVMIQVCAKALGVGEEDVVFVETDFGADGATVDAARRRKLQTSSSSAEAGGVEAGQLTPVTTCEVFLGSDGETRAAAAAAAVDRLLDPDNFVLLMEENDFGPVNAVVTEVVFWQDGCTGSCPAGDGSYASVFPIDTAGQGEIASQGEDDERHLLWFIVLVAALAGVAVLSWIVMCCSRRAKKQDCPKRTIEERYTIKPSNSKGEISGAPPTASPTVAAARGLKLPAPIVAASKRGGNEDRKSGVGVRGPVEPGSPGEAHWRWKFGLNPSREMSYRSAPISPRRSGSASTESSEAKIRRIIGNPFFATSSSTHEHAGGVDPAYGDREGQKFGYPNLKDHSSAGSRDLSPWQDILNPEMRHANDPLQPSSRAKSDGRTLTYTHTSPRKELNRLHESLDKQHGFSQTHASNNTDETYTPSPTTTVSTARAGLDTADASPSPCVRAGEGGFSDNSTRDWKVPVYEIDLKADDSGNIHAETRGPGPADPSPSPRVRRRDCSDSAAGSIFPTGDAAGENRSAFDDELDDTESSVATSVSGSSQMTPRRAHPGRNPFARAPGSASRSRSVKRTGSSVSETSPLSSAMADGSESAAREKSAAAAEAVASDALPRPLSPNRHAVRYSAVTGEPLSPRGPRGRVAGAATGAVLVRSDSRESKGSVLSDVSSMAVMPSLPRSSARSPRSNLPADIPDIADGSEGAAGVEVVMVTQTGPNSHSPIRVAPAAAPALPWGGVLSKFACLTLDNKSPSADTASGSPQRPWAWNHGWGNHAQNPPGRGSANKREDEGRGAVTLAEAGAIHGGGQCRPPGCPGRGEGPRAATAAMPPPAPLTLERALAISRSRAIMPDLAPVAEDTGERGSEFFSDSDTESDVSSVVSSRASSLGGGKSARDPAALLAAAIEKAGQIASIPAPSSGSMAYRGPLPPLKETPVETSSSPAAADRNGELGVEGLAGEGSDVEKAAAVAANKNRKKKVVWSPSSDDVNYEDAASRLSAAGFSAANDVAMEDAFGEDLRSSIGGGSSKGVPPRHAESSDTLAYSDDGSSVGCAAQVETESATAMTTTATATTLDHGDTTDIDQESLQGEAHAVEPRGGDSPTTPSARFGGVFSLMGALSAFLGKRSPPAAQGTKTESGVPRPLAGSAEEAFMVADAIFRARRIEEEKANLETERMRQPREDTNENDDVGHARGDPGVSVVAGKTLEEKSTSTPLSPARAELSPLIVNPEGDEGTYIGPGDVSFSRATMNVQSPEPEAPSPMTISESGSAFPGVAERAVERDDVGPASNSMRAGTDGPAGGLGGDFSPMYDREAIARAMEEAAAEGREESHGLNTCFQEDSDMGISIPNSTSWPSARRTYSSADLGRAKG